MYIENEPQTPSLRVILEEITKRVTRDNGVFFTDTSRMDYIKSILGQSEYEILKATNLALIYKKKYVELPEKLVLLSSHIDCKQCDGDDEGIYNPNFERTKKGNYRGTFDNAATNAAIVIAMIENKLSDNIIISFTGDEEEEQNGAKEVIEFLEKEKKKVIAISLDVTFDLKSEECDEISTYKYASYTIDNLCNNTEKSIARLLFEIANELGIPYMVTRAGDEDYFDSAEDVTSCYYEDKLEAEGTAWEDEAITYSKNRNCIGAFSFCLPTNDTEDECNMHTDTLIKIKKKSFDEYIEAVTQISNRMTEV